MDEPQKSTTPEPEPGLEPRELSTERVSPDEQITTAPGRTTLGTGPRLLVYIACSAVTIWLTLWFGTSFFGEPIHGPAVLWQQMYAEAALAFGVLLPAILMARIEGKPVDEYGLPRREVFGKMFWLGSTWGLVSITALMLVLRGAHAFYFGRIVLHGQRVLRFALFWAAYFVLVGLFEEFLLRGYTLHTLARRFGFWPAATLMSLVFGAIHVRNPGETWIGLLGVVAIGFFFCLTLYRTGNLWFAVGFHALWDWGQTYLYSVPDSGTFEPGHLMQPSFKGPDWLTGGSAGPEASLLCFAVIAGVSGVFAWRYRTLKHSCADQDRDAHLGL